MINYFILFELNSYFCKNKTSKNLQKGSVFIITWDSRNEGGNNIAYLSKTLLSRLEAMLFSQVLLLSLLLLLFGSSYTTNNFTSDFLWFVGFLTHNPALEQ